MRSGPNFLCHGICAKSKIPVFHPTDFASENSTYDNGSGVIPLQIRNSRLFTNLLELGGPITSMTSGFDIPTESPKTRVSYDVDVAHPGSINMVHTKTQTMVKSIDFISLI